MTASPAPAALVPHAGAMCLLDTVVAWDDARVTCASTSHRRPDNPLRREGRLAALHLVEYAAQATAVHGGLLAGGGAPAPPRVLAGVRDCVLHVSSLDDVPGTLTIEAERLMAMGESTLYGFRVSAADGVLATGRLSIARPAGPCP